MAIGKKRVKRLHGKPGEDDHKIDWLLPLARYEVPWWPLEGVCGGCRAAIGLVPSFFVVGTGARYTPHASEMKLLGICLSTVQSVR